MLAYAQYCPVGDRLTLLEWYLNPGTNALASTTILPVTQWKYKFVSASVTATGTSTTTTTTTVKFFNTSYSNPGALINAGTSTTSLSVSAEQYPAGGGNNYFSPLVGNTLEGIIVAINNAAAVADNYALFAIEIDLDGDFDE